MLTWYLILKVGSNFYNLTAISGANKFAGQDTVSNTAADLISGAGAVEYIEQIFLPGSHSILNPVTRSLLILLRFMLMVHWVQYHLLQVKILGLCYF
jgi:hypothetical protein